MIPVALIDDHVLLRNALAIQINALNGYQVIMQSANGRQFSQQLGQHGIPSIVLVDVIMPEMDGFDTVLWISRTHPTIRTVVLSMLYDESTIIRMLRNGAKAYLTKDTEMQELQKGLDEVWLKGFYFNRYVYNNLIHTIKNGIAEEEPDYRKAASLTNREKEFLQWLCRDKAYKEIAAAMYVSPRTIDGYRDSLFAKLKVASKIGLVTFAIRNHIAQV